MLNEWRTGLGFYLQIHRGIWQLLRRVGINPAQCAVGLRVATILRRLGAQEDNFESFISDIYNRCYNDLGLTSERICLYMTHLAELSDSMHPSQIPNYISQKKHEKTN
jgi:hypothetical protein